MTKRSYAEAVLAGLADYEAGKSGAGAPAPHRSYTASLLVTAARKEPGSDQTLSAWSDLPRLTNKFNSSSSRGPGAIGGQYADRHLRARAGAQSFELSIGLARALGRLQARPAERAARPARCRRPSSAPGRRAALAGPPSAPRAAAQAARAPRCGCC